MKKTPLKRKMSLRDSYARKLKAEKTKIVWSTNGKPKKRKPLKKISKAQRTRLKKYFPIQHEFLIRPENHDCLICIRRREAGENIVLNKATEVHHKFGRAGDLLYDVRGFVACCRNCRDLPHSNPKWAREVGLLAPAAAWNTSLK